MKIVITGGAGFIGSHIADAYISAGHDVVVIDNLSSGKKENLNPSARFYHADITDKVSVGKILESESPDIINHHAAQIDVRRSVADPAFDARVNIIGTINLLEAARQAGCVRKIIFASSGGTIYGECPLAGEAANAFPDESSAPNPMSPYGVSKLASEFYLKYYSSQFGIKFTILRYANVYGPRQDPHGEAGVVAIFSGKILSGEECAIYGDGKQMRDYVYAGDVARANLSALLSGDDEIINIGTSVATDVNKLYSIMVSLEPSYSKKAVYRPPRAGELFRSVLNIKKAAKVLNWQPSVTLEEGLKITMEFFRKKISRNKAGGAV